MAQVPFSSLYSYNHDYMPQMHKSLGTLICEHVALFITLGVKVPITSSVYGYTKVLAHNLNSKKISGAAIG